MSSYADIKIKALSSSCCTRHLKSVIHFVCVICTHVPLIGYTGSPRQFSVYHGNGDGEVCAK